MTERAILAENHTIIPATLHEWAQWRDTAQEKRRVDQTTLPSGKWISTVFLGIDLSFGEGPPLYFETMVFPNERNMSELDCERCSTWDEAVAQHKAMVEKYS